MTRESAGSVFHTQLARELSECIAQPLQRAGHFSFFIFFVFFFLFCCLYFVAGGMLSLVDVYCFYNRARGVNLISPDDLLVETDACGNLLPNIFSLLAKNLIALDFQFVLGGSNLVFWYIFIFNSCNYKDLLNSIFLQVLQSNLHNDDEMSRRIVGELKRRQEISKVILRLLGY